MTVIESELHEIALELHDLVSRARNPDIVDTLRSLRDAAERVGMAWSGSWLGYHANVYYRDLQKPPPGMWFSKEWGLRPGIFVDDSTSGDWAEFDPDQVRAAI